MVCLLCETFHEPVDIQYSDLMKCCIWLLQHRNSSFSKPTYFIYLAKIRTEVSVYISDENIMKYGNNVFPKTKDVSFQGLT